MEKSLAISQSVSSIDDESPKTAIHQVSAIQRPARVNVGCGATPINGWLNFDNSLTVRLAAFPMLLPWLRRLQLLNGEQLAFARSVAEHRVEWAEATRTLPLRDASVEVLYSSHMLEHLDHSERDRFLKEAKRVLVPGGIIRLVVPDLAKMIRNYSQTGDADTFVASTLLSTDRPAGLLARLRLLLVGTRHHAWMYDAGSLERLLISHGFVRATSMPPGETLIPNPGPLNLREREDESVFVEATKPSVGLH